MGKNLLTIIIAIILGVLSIMGIATLILKFHDSSVNTISEENANISIHEKLPDVENKPIEEDINLKQTEGVTVVPTMFDTIEADSSWCGTFQLVWNDMKNEVVKKDIVFNPQLDIVNNLNQEDFDQTMLSENYYFKIYGLKSLELKEKIEKGIKEKFNQTSDILNDFDWSESELNDPNNPFVKRYFFYTMLYKKFEFMKKFDTLDNDNFGDNHKNVEYFGINSETDNSVGNQIDVLYYNSKDDFAILINTKTYDDVIFCKNPKGDTFNKIYENMNQEAERYTGSTSFEKIDEFKAPKISINEKKEYKELENKQFKTADNSIGEILKALQTIKFSLDENGGEIKSEAGMDVEVLSAVIEKPIEEEPRYFYVDDTFAIFLREKGKTKPYFAGRIDDITKFQ